MNEFNDLCNYLLNNELVIEATFNVNDPSGRSYKKGSLAEVEFAKILQKDLGENWRVATQDEEIRDHIDFVLDPNGKNRGVEVKSNKDNLMQGWMLAELQGITGRPGWIYGRSHYIAYERPTYFKIYDTEKLRSYVEDTVSDEFVNNRDDARYKVYQRPGRQDKVTFIELEDLDSIVKPLIMRKV